MNYILKQWFISSKITTEEKINIARMFSFLYQSFLKHTFLDYDRKKWINNITLQNMSDRSLWKARK
jgi:hypothetical protein